MAANSERMQGSGMEGKIKCHMTQEENDMLFLCLKKITAGFNMWDFTLDSDPAVSRHTCVD